MPLSAEITTLQLRDTFTISRSSVDTEQVLTVTLQHDGLTGYGEGAPVEYDGETADSLREAVEAEGIGLLGQDLGDLAGIAERLQDWDGPQGAKMALDGVAHDWVGRRYGLPVRRLLGAPGQLPPTSFTLSIASIEETVRQLAEHPDFVVYKVKVGGPDDLARLRAIRDNTDARLRIDGNEGWTLDQARELLPELSELGVEMIEQPFPRGDGDAYAGYHALPDRLPVFLDESCTDLRSVPAAAGLADGIVIKLSKCGGIHEALRMVHAARALGLQVMLGCMIESQLGIAQAAQLGALVDLIDLDGYLLITDQPFEGLGLAAGRLVLPDRPGLGVEPAAVTQ